VAEDSEFGIWRKYVLECFSRFMFFLLLFAVSPPAFQWFIKNKEIKLRW